MVSMSITWMSLKPERARFLRISQPNPPAPMTRTLELSSWEMVSEPGTKCSSVKGVVWLRTLSRYFLERDLSKDCRGSGSEVHSYHRARESVPLLKLAILL